MSKTLLRLLLLSVITIPVHTVETESRIFKSAASLGMGGVGVSTIGYQFSAIRNPAALGLMADHDIAPFISLGASLNPEMINLLNQLPDLASGSTDFTDINYDSFIGKMPTIGFNGPLNVGYMGKGFGFWTTSSTEGRLAVIENPDNILSQNGLSVGFNNLAQAGSDILDIVNNNQTPTQSQLENIFQQHIGNDLINQGLTEEQADETIKALANKFKDDPSSVEEELKNILPKARLDLTAEIAVNLAYGYRIPFAAIDEVSGLSLGATVRFSQRFKLTTGSEPLVIDQFVNTISSITDNIYQASSISSDFGMSLRLENLIIGVAVRDALSTQYVWKNLLDPSLPGIQNSQIPYSVDFGASYRFYFDNNWIQEVGAYVEFENSTSDTVSWLNKLRVGSEVKLFNFLDLRVGMYKGFVTGGLGMGWKWFRMDFAYYRETYLDIFTSDQYYINMTVGLDNSPRRKARSIKKQLQQDRIQAQNLELLNNSLSGLDN